MKWVVYIALAVSVLGCRKEYADSYVKITDWKPETHGNDAAPDYSVVFKEGKVHRIDLVFQYSDWSKMQNDLEANVKITNPPTPVNPAYVPVYVPCNVLYNGIEWYKVGVRYKGNSSLRTALQRKIRKLSFKLDFDQFEDQYPAIKNQRFYGFKQLNLSNGFDDISLMREKTASDLFREFGIPSARTAFCEVWVNYGQGEKYFGLYTMIEEVEDTMINTQFEGDGNLYKPEGPAATFAYGTYNQMQLYKQNNTDENDYSDILSFYNILNSSSRLNNHIQWMSDLETVFSVPVFLKWLAANTTMENWDTYGKMSHNYYLYNDPASGRLTWIPWDNNEALRQGKNGGGLSLSLTEVSNGWPVIRFLANDTSYYRIYKNSVASFASGLFSASSINERIDRQASLIRFKAMNEKPGYTFLSTPATFDTGITELKQHCQNRRDAVGKFLAR
jgi:spore coat protein CotH